MKNRITHVQFFQVCEELRNQREQIEKNCNKRSEVIAMIEPKLGFVIPGSTIEEALKTVGITLKPKKGNYSNDARIKTAKVLAKAIKHLYEKLGEPIPTDLAEICGRLDLGVGLSTGKPILSIPVKSIPSPQTIPVVNKKA